MKKSCFSLAMILVFASTGCGPTMSGTALDAGSDGQEKPVAQIASGGVTPDVPPEPTGYEGPPHIFEPKSHSPRNRYGNIAPADLQSLPKFKFRYNKCFRPKRERRQLGGNKPGRVLGSLSSAGSGYGVSAGPSARPSKPKPSTPPPPSPTAGAGSVDVALADVMGAADMSQAAQPASAPMAESATVSEREESKNAEMPALDKKIASDEDADRFSDDESEPITGGEEMRYDDWGAAIYLSNDDTMSLSSAQRVIYAIDNFLPLPQSHIRPHELLNYFSFDTAPVNPGNDFSVYGELSQDSREEGIYSLGLSVDGRPVDKASRRNAAITLVIDRSGSMRDEGRMDYLKRGLDKMLGELKTGDMVHMVLFDHNVCVPAENFVVGRDDPRKLKRIINKLKPRGSTDLHKGLSRGYDIADRSYRQNYTNRVVMVTDALTNTGVTDQEMISMISNYYDSRRIRLSGIGVGRNFNDALLDRLTERGKGAYVFLGSEAEVDAVFGNRFISLIETTALDVHFRLHLPPSLRMNVFYGEESSTVKEDVQEIHYFAGTSQLFLSDLMARGGEIRPQDSVMLTIEYKDPETGQELVEEYAFVLGELMERNLNVKKARLVMTWIDMLAQMASHPVPRHYYSRAASWQDPTGWQRCQDGSNELARLSEGVSDDPEIQRVLRLWEKHCARYERPRHPVKREIVPNPATTPVPAKDAWPGAK